MIKYLYIKNRNNGCITVWQFDLESGKTRLGFVADPPSKVPVSSLVWSLRPNSWAASLEKAKAYWGDNTSFSCHEISREEFITHLI